MASHGEGSEELTGIPKLYAQDTSPPVGINYEKH